MLPFLAFIQSSSRVPSASLRQAILVRSNLFCVRLPCFLFLSLVLFAETPKRLIPVVEVVSLPGS